MKRILYAVVVFLSILYLPWVITASCIVAGVFLFDKYFESVLWIIVIETLYGPENVALWEHTFALGMLGVIMFAFIVKRAIRFYD